MRPETLVFYAAVCEIVAEIVERGVHAGDGDANPYVTAEDFAHVRELWSRIEKLRVKAGCPNFLVAAGELLARESTCHEAGAAELRQLCAGFDEVSEALDTAVREAVEGLRAEACLLIRHQRSQRTPSPSLEQLLQRHGIAEVIAAVDRDALLIHRPDEAAVQEKLDGLRAKIGSAATLARSLTDRCAAVVESARHRVVDRGLIVDINAAEPDPDPDPAILAAGGEQSPFLRDSHPPVLERFRCAKGPALFLNAAEDVVGGGIVLRTAQSVSEAYRRFVTGLCDVDGLIVRAERCPDRVREALAATTALLERITAAFSPANLAAAGSAVQSAMHDATHLMSRAVQLAKLGDIARARRLRDLAMRQDDTHGDAAALEAAIAEQKTSLKLLDMSFKDLAAEPVPQQTGWRGIFGRAAAAASPPEQLRVLLEIFHNHHARVQWAAGSECGATLASLLRKAEQISTAAGLRPIVPAWVHLHEALGRVRPRPVSPAAAFANVLGAMVAADGKIMAEEREAVRRSLEQVGLQMTPSDLDRVISAWGDVQPGEPMCEAVAQAIADVAVIRDPTVLEKLIRHMGNAAKVDNAVRKSEMHVYRGLFCAIMRQAYEGPAVVRRHAARGE